MPADGAADRQTNSPSSPLPATTIPTANGNANGIGSLPMNSNFRLRLNPRQDHQPESYEDLQSEFTPLLFSSLERYLPPNLLNVTRDTKHRYMREVLRRYSTEGERNRVSISFYVIMYSHTVVEICFESCREVNEQPIIMISELQSAVFIDIGC
ncbi:hypothetical protein Hanom_Chr15g01387411 [Helianthus anomalus]